MQTDYWMICPCSSVCVCVVCELVGKLGNEMLSYEQEPGMAGRFGFSFTSQPKTFLQEMLAAGFILALLDVVGIFNP